MQDSNFAYLSEENPFLYITIQSAEYNPYQDPITTLFKIRQFREVLNEIKPNDFELPYNSWDIKAFTDDLWKEADEGLKDALEKQWQENQAVTGGHKWAIPEWADVYAEIEWEREKGCPLPPFKWDEERRAQLKAELDAYFALLYGLERDELRYILDPKEVYGKDFPGETFRVLKNKETKKYGEYRTRRLVLEAYDRLRPTWDMEAHLEKLKEIWEECQLDLSGKSNMNNNQTKEQAKPRESKEVVMGLFGEK